MTLAQKRILAGVAAGAVLLLVGYLLLVLTSGGTASAGTSVQGVDISGMTEPEAIDALEEALGPDASKKIKVTVADATIKVSPEEAGLTLDAAASVAPAYEHSWNPLTLLANLFGGRQMDAVVAVDQTRLADQLAVMTASIEDPPVEPSVQVKKSGPTVIPGSPGRTIDEEATTEALRQAVLSSASAVDAVVVSVEPSVTPQAVDEAVALANAATSAPVTVKAASVTATIPPAAIRRALSFTAEDGALVPELDGARLHRAIAEELAPIEEPGRDATFKIRKGVPKVVKSKVGTGVSDDELASAVAAVLASAPGDRTVTVTVGTRPPKLTTEAAQALGVKERLSRFTQNYPYAAYRSQNIGEAAKRINGTLLMPGETFSLNDVIKERTEENGYTVGYVVGEGGVFREDLGGGVSTSATTAWTAAFFAGLERVQTVAHSVWISRYQAGLEATVAWGIFDLKFRNDTPNAVFITASTTPTSITVSMWGTKEYDRIEAESGPRRDIVKYKKIYDESPECRGQNGVDGFTITVDRVFYKDGEEVRREPITTRYKATPDVTCGPKPDKKKKPDKKNPDAATTDDSAGQPTDGPSDAPSAKPSDEPSTPPPGDGNVFSNG